MTIRALEEIARECDGHRRHATRLRHQQQSPAIDEGDGWMIGFPQVRILASQAGPARCEFRPDETAGEGDHAAQRPSRQDERRCSQLTRHDIGIDKDTKSR